MNMVVSAIYRYPVKSGYREELESLFLDRRGFEFDRDWMVVGSNWNFMSQRDFPKLANLRAIIIPRPTYKFQLSLGHTNGTSIIEVTPSKERMELATVWGTECIVYDEGDKAAGWLSEYLEQDCRLVRMAEDFERKVKPKYADHGQLGFADGAPLLITSTASLDDFNRYLASIGVPGLAMNRFRPNIVIDGIQESWQEDTWHLIRINGVEYEIAWPCTRCRTINVDQETGIVDDFNYMELLQQYHAINGASVFGQNAIHREEDDPVSVGDQVEVLEYKTA